MLLSRDRNDRDDSWAVRRRILQPVISLIPNLPLIPCKPLNMWERTLQDLIRGLRAHKSSSRGELEAFLSECVEEIRGELRGREMDLKAEGVVKMCYVSTRVVWNRMVGRDRG